MNQAIHVAQKLAMVVVAIQMIRSFPTQIESFDQKMMG
jgi:hypothetical protein